MSWQELCEKSDKRVMELEAELEAVKLDWDLTLLALSELRSANAQLTKEKDLEKQALAALRSRCVNKPCHGPDNLLGEWEDGQIHCWECEFHTLEARVKLYEDASDPGKLYVLIAQFVCESDSGPEWMRKLADKISASSIDAAEAGSEPLFEDRHITPKDAAFLREMNKVDEESV